MKQLMLLIENKPFQVIMDDVSHFTLENDRYTWMVYSNGKRKLLRITISEIFEQLPNPPFLLVDRNNIIHSGSITKMQSEPQVKIWMQNGYEFVINN